MKVVKYKYDIAKNAHTQVKSLELYLSSLHYMRVLILLWLKPWLKQSDPFTCWTDQSWYSYISQTAVRHPEPRPFLCQTLVVSTFCFALWLQRFDGLSYASWCRPDTTSPCTTTGSSNLPHHLQNRKQFMCLFRRPFPGRKMSVGFSGPEPV